MKQRGRHGLCGRCNGFAMLAVQRFGQGVRLGPEPDREVSLCPDFIEDRGHTFGRDLSDQDKRALIEYMKYF